MLIYTGAGWSVLVLFFVTMIAGLVFFKDFRQDSPVYRTPWPEVIVMSVNVVGCWLLGRWLNRGRPRKIFEFNLHKAGHTFCFVRVEFCGVFSILLYGLGVLKGGLFL